MGIKVLTTINQYAKIRNVTRMTVYRWLKLGKLEVYRSPNGKHWFILDDVPDIVEGDGDTVSELE